MYRSAAHQYKRDYLPHGQCHFYLRHGYCKNLSVCKWEHPELDETNAEYRYKSEHFSGTRMPNKRPPMPMNKILSSAPSDEIIKQQRFREHELQLEFERQKAIHDRQQIHSYSPSHSRRDKNHHRRDYNRNEEDSILKYPEEKRHLISKKETPDKHRSHHRHYHYSSGDHKHKNIESNEDSESNATDIQSSVVSEDIDINEETEDNESIQESVSKKTDKKGVEIVSDKKRSLIYSSANGKTHESDIEEGEIKEEPLVSNEKNSKIKKFDSKLNAEKHSSKLESIPKTEEKIKNEEQISECAKWIEIGCCEQFKNCPHFHEGVECDVWVEYGRCPQKEEGKCNDFHHRSIWAQSKLQSNGSGNGNGNGQTKDNIPPPPPTKIDSKPKKSKIEKKKKKRKRKKKMEENEKSPKKSKAYPSSTSSSSSSTHSSIKHSSKRKHRSSNRSRSRSHSSTKIKHDSNKSTISKHKDGSSDVSSISFESLASDASDTSQRMHRLRYNVVRMFKLHRQIFQRDLRDVYYKMFKSEMNIECFGFLNMISFLKSIKCLSMSQSSNGNLIILNSLGSNYRGQLHHFNYNKKRFPHNLHVNQYPFTQQNMTGNENSGNFRMFNNQQHQNYGRVAFDGHVDGDSGRFEREPPMKKRKQEMKRNSY